MSSFEEALHQGYSAEDMAADMKEKEIRCMDLGCNSCRYQDRNSPTCERMIDGDLNVCPYYKEEV